MKKLIWIFQARIEKKNPPHQTAVNRGSEKVPIVLIPKKASNMTKKILLLWRLLIMKNINVIYHKIKAGLFEFICHILAHMDSA